MVQYRLLLSSRTARESSGYQYSWELEDETMQLMQEFGIRVKSVVFKNAMLPVNSNNNELVIEEDGGNTFTVVVPEGYYSNTEIAGELSTLATAAGTFIYTIKYDDTLGRLEFDVTGGFKFLSVGSSAGNILGITSGDFNTSYITSVFNPMGILDINGADYVDIHINFATNTYVHGQSGDVLVRVPLEKGFNELIVYEPQYPDDVRVFGRNLDQLRIALIDDHGNAYDLPENVNISLVFELDVEF